MIAAEEIFFITTIVEYSCAAFVKNNTFFQDSLIDRKLKKNNNYWPKTFE